MTKRVLTIQDYSSVGQCSLSVALPILTAFGCYTVGLPTALLSTQTGGIDGYTFTDLSTNMMPAFEHWNKLNLDFDCVYTGFLGTMQTLENAFKIVQKLKEKGVMIAVDPAMADGGKLYDLFDENYKNRMIEFCGCADIVLPNFTEGKMLANLDMNLEPNEENARMILNILKYKNYKTVILSGIQKDNQMGVALLNDGKIELVYNDSFSQTVHGAGDVLASAFIGKLMQGEKIYKSAESAVKFCRDCIDQTIQENRDFKFGMAIENVIPNVLKY